MKLLYTADPHYSSYSQDKIINISGLPEKLHNIHYTMLEIITYALENKIYNIVVGGDLYHNKNIIHSIAQSLILDLIRSHPQIHFYILDGNHDMSSMTGDGVSATKSLDNEKNVTTIHETKQIENIVFVPWNPKKMFKDIKDSKTDYLISHFGLNEGKLNSGISIISDIGLKDLNHFKHCFLGHYHSPQQVGNVTYVGSPIQLDWGEKNEEKRFLSIDSETGSVISIPTTSYKKYFEFKITKENKEEIVKNAIGLKNQGHYIKLIKEDDIDMTDVENVLDVIDRREKDITNRGMSSSMSRSDKLERYLEIKNIKKEDRQKYKEIAVDIMDSIL